MRKAALFAVCLLFAASTVATAADVAGVKLPDTTQIDGKSLKLNGAGLRSKFFVKVYVAGLYLESPASSAKQVLSADQARQVKMVMTRELGKDKIAEAIVDGFEKNNRAQMPALKARLDRLIAAIPDLKEGNELVISYLPGKGTSVSSSTGQTITVEGKDFADALFSVWLGDHPVDAKLKSAMLGM